MSSQNFHSDWHRLRKLKHDEVYLDHGSTASTGRLLIVGMTDHDWSLGELGGHYLYDLPEGASWAEIARFFGVGSHNASDPEHNIALIASKVAAIQTRIRGRVIFADGGGMKILFGHALSMSDYEFVKDLYPEQDMLPGGLEKHLHEWSGDDHPLECLLTNPLLHLWWD